MVEKIVGTQSSWIPNAGWLVAAGRWAGVAEPATLRVAWWLLLVSGLALCVGWCTREAAVIAAFVHLCFVKSSGPLSYGVDSMATMALFYLCISPLPDRVSLDAQWRGVLQPTHGRGLVRRVLRWHLCLIYLSSGLTKAAGTGWWNGNAVWRALWRPPFNSLPLTWVELLAPVLPLIGIGIVVIEVGYPLAMSCRRSRPIWLGLTIAMHLGIAIGMGLYSFAWMMIVLNCAAFAPSAAAKWVGSRFDSTFHGAK